MFKTKGMYIEYRHRRLIIADVSACRTCASCTSSRSTEYCGLILLWYNYHNCCLKTPSITNTLYHCVWLCKHGLHASTKCLKHAQPSLSMNHNGNTCTHTKIIMYTHHTHVIHNNQSMQNTVILKFMTSKTHREINKARIFETDTSHCKLVVCNHMWVVEACSCY